MSPQEAFNRVWDWFIIQRKPRSASVKEVCLYRSGTSKCAVGVLIPDEMYHIDMEYMEITTLLNSFPAFKEYLGAAKDIATAMQLCHDISSTGEFHLQMMKGMMHLVNDFKLEIHQHTPFSAYHTVWKWFVVDKHPPGRVDTMACQYRTRNGDKCAAGCLIPDSIYDPAMDSEIMLINVLRIKFQVIDNLFKHCVDIVSDMQFAHDNHFDVFESKMLVIKKRYNIEDFQC